MSALLQVIFAEIGRSEIIFAIFAEIKGVKMFEIYRKNLKDRLNC